MFDENRIPAFLLFLIWYYNCVKSLADIEQTIEWSVFSMKITIAQTALVMDKMFLFRNLSLNRTQKRNKDDIILKQDKEMFLLLDSIKS